MKYRGLKRRLVALALGAATAGISPAQADPNAAVCLPDEMNGTYDGSTFDIEMFCDGRSDTGSSYYGLRVAKEGGSPVTWRANGSSGEIPGTGICRTEIVGPETGVHTHYVIHCTLTFAGDTVDMTLWISTTESGSPVGASFVTGTGYITGEDPPPRGIGSFVGFTCGFTSTNDETGQVIQDPHTQVGEVDGGPWTVVGGTSVTISCIISVGDGIIDAGDTVVTQTTPGSVGVLASPVSYQATPGQEVWLCTQVSWTLIDGTGDKWGGDLNDPDNNPYCDLAISIET